MSFFKALFICLLMIAPVSALAAPKVFTRKQWNRSTFSERRAYSKVKSPWRDETNFSRGAQLRAQANRMDRLHQAVVNRIQTGKKAVNWQNQVRNLENILKKAQLDPANHAELLAKMRQVKDYQSFISNMNSLKNQIRLVLMQQSKKQFDEDVERFQKRVRKNAARSLLKASPSNREERALQRSLIRMRKEEGPRFRVFRAGSNGQSLRKLWLIGNLRAAQAAMQASR
jgi:hypothetical protein